MDVDMLAERTGLTRSNIRYYEAEGLLRPDRAEDGRREYTGEHVQILKKILLLRRLGATAAEIRAAGADYEGLDVRRYQDFLTIPDGQSLLPAWAQRDAVQTEQYPWRRLFGWYLDALVCSLLSAAVYYLMLHHIPANGIGEDLLLFVCSTGLLLLLEPLCLHVWGTTPGKWIFGVRIADWDGRHLSYGRGLRRTWERLRYGEGFSIPFYCLYRLYKSYVLCREDALPWDEALSYSYRDAKGWRIAAFLGALALLFCVTLLIAGQSILPVHRGDLTISEFADNYNFYVENLEIGGSVWKLDGEGRSIEAPEPGEVFGLEPPTAFRAPAFRYTVEDGRLTGVSYELEYAGADLIFDYDAPMVLAAMAFIGARTELRAWNGGFRTLTSALENQAPGSFTYTQAGVRLQWTLETENMQAGPWTLTPEEGKAGRCRIAMSLELVS